MFTDLLAEEEKKVYLTLLYYLSGIDNEISKEEIEFIQQAAIDINYLLPDVKVLKKHCSLEDILSKIKTSTSSKIIIIELINIAYADNKYKEEEHASIFKIAKLLGITEDKFREIEKWVYEGIKWKNNGLELINN